MSDNLTISVFELIKNSHPRLKQNVTSKRKRWNEKPVCPFYNCEEKQYRFTKNGVEGYHLFSSCKKNYHEHRTYIGSQFARLSVNHSANQFINGVAHTNSIESVWSILKQGFYGIYNSFSIKYLQRYVDEFIYRLNERNVQEHALR